VRLSEPSTSRQGRRWCLRGNKGSGPEKSFGFSLVKRGFFKFLISFWYKYSTRNNLGNTQGGDTMSDRAMFAVIVLFLLFVNWLLEPLINLVVSKGAISDLLWVVVR
jgi:hypothetical protein